jgi:hypothetical protein
MHCYYKKERIMDYTRMSCTKLRNFLESKRTEWLAENISLSDLQIMKRRVYQCSPEVHSKLSRLFGFLEHKIARR